MARPRGYADWNPNADSLALIDNVRAVLKEYREHLPITARQVFYRLVGAYGYEKTERAYNNLCEKIVRARRAEMISFASIRDDGTDSGGGDSGYEGPEDFWEAIKESANYYRRRRTEGQEKRIELWCEAKGMLPQLVRVARDYGVTCYATGGFSSVTVTHEIAQRVVRAGAPTIFLHVGDFDPSGESIFEAMSYDAWAFVAGEEGSTQKTDELFVAKRVALTAEQVERHGLPTAPPKRSDSRSASWDGETCQAEAMPPDLLAETVREAIEEHFDMEQLNDVLRISAAEKAELIERLEAAMEGS
jgi:hypothetical protein